MLFKLQFEKDACSDCKYRAHCSPSRCSLLPACYRQAASRLCNLSVYGMLNIDETVMFTGAENTKPFVNAFLVGWQAALMKPLVAVTAS